MKTKMMTKIALAALLSTSVFAEVKNADELIKTMKKEDITYAQLMSGMSMAINNIQTGIISMNKMLVDRGIDFIRTHPAPKQKPWVIMDKKDREGFKASLVHFDKKMDDDVLLIEKAVAKKDWASAMDGLNTFQNTCISCHTTWKNEVKYIMK
jgi:hypothetical protein